MNQEKFEQIVNKLYIDKDPNSIKTDCGQAWMIGSSKSYPNAITIASLLCDISGVGYGAVSIPDDVYSVVMSRVPLTDIYEPLKTKDDIFLVEENKSIIDKGMNRYTSILIGNGLKFCEENYRFLSYIIENYHGNLIIDATGIALLAEYGTDVLMNRKTNSNIILTPHLGEAKKLLKSNITTRDPIQYVPETIDFCKTNNVFVLLKSVKSVLVSDSGKSSMSFYPPTPTLAHAGSGDGLAGYLTGVLAYGTKYFDLYDLILYADQMVHFAAINAGDVLSSGYSNILSVPNEILKIIKNCIIKTQRSKK